MGRKGTPLPHLQFIAPSVAPPQIVTKLGKAYDHGQGRGTNLYVTFHTS